MTRKQLPYLYKVSETRGVVSLRSVEGIIGKHSSPCFSFGTHREPTVCISVFIAHVERRCSASAPRCGFRGDWEEEERRGGGATWPPLECRVKKVMEAHPHLWPLCFPNVLQYRPMLLLQSCRPQFFFIVCNLSTFKWQGVLWCALYCDDKWG